MPIHPYLFFTGTCREAMTRYHEVLGGRLDVMTVADMPEDAQPPPGPPNPDLLVAPLRHVHRPLWHVVDGERPGRGGAAMMRLVMLLGGGKTVFPADGEKRPLELVRATTAASGVLCCVYGPSETTPMPDWPG